LLVPLSNKLFYFTSPLVGEVDRALRGRVRGGYEERIVSTSCFFLRSFPSPSQAALAFPSPARGEGIMGYKNFSLQSFTRSNGSAECSFSAAMTCKRGNKPCRLAI